MFFYLCSHMAILKIESVIDVLIWANQSGCLLFIAPLLHRHHLLTRIGQLTNIIKNILLSRILACNIYSIWQLADIMNCISILEIPLLRCSKYVYFAYHFLRYLNSNPVSSNRMAIKSNPWSLN